ncbi:MAG: hypothetical protein ACK5HT_00705 [Draconibacterium sp.]
MKTKNLFENAKAGFNLLLMVFFVVGSVTLTSCEHDDEPMPEPEMEKTIVDVVAEAGSFQILLQAAQKAGLANFLNTEKLPYYVELIFV